MKKIRISEAEWEVMEVLWNKSARTATDVVDALTVRHSWAPTTIRTLLSRLADKKIIRMEKIERAVSFRPLISREECVQQESDTFLHRVFGGATKPLLLHFAAKAKLNADEIKELGRILKEKGKGRS